MPTLCVCWGMNSFICKAIKAPNGMTQSVINCGAMLQISAARLEEVRQELGSLTDTLQPLQLRYAAEKTRLDELRSLQQKQQDLQAKLDQAEYRMDQVTAADIK